MGESPKRISVWEWAAGAVAFAMLVAIFVTLAMKGSEEKSPPVLSLHVDGIEQSGSYHLVRFTIRNDGGSTAAGVVVEGRVTASSEPPEVSTVTLDYEGKPTAAYNAGESFFVDAGKVHEGINKGTVPAKILATLVVKSGEALTTQEK